MNLPKKAKMLFSNLVVVDSLKTDREWKTVVISWSDHWKKLTQKVIITIREDVDDTGQAKALCIAYTKDRLFTTAWIPLIDSVSR